MVSERGISGTQALTLSLVSQHLKPTSWDHFSRLKGLRHVILAEQFWGQAHKRDVEVHTDCSFIPATTRLEWAWCPWESAGVN